MNNCMWKWINIAVFIFALTSLSAAQPVRIKELVTVDGIKENQLTGVGLVIGLQGKGDSTKFGLTQKMLLQFAANNGFDVSLEELKSKNVAAVVVNAKIDSFHRMGDRIDVNVSSIGDSKSLEGGMLVQTALKGADQAVYAVAQGRVLSGSNKGMETSASIPDGAVMEREVVGDFVKDGKIRLNLVRPDFTTVGLIQTAIADSNEELQVKAIDSGCVEVTLTGEALVNPIAVMSQIEALTVTPDVVAVVVIDKKSGVVVSGGNVVVQECSVSTPALSVSVGSSSKSKGSKKNTIKVQATTVDDFVTLLTQANVSTKELISLLEAVKKSGALNARIVVL